MVMIIIIIIINLIFKSKAKDLWIVGQVLINANNQIIMTWECEL